MLVDQFSIQKLHGTLNYELKLKDNILILIGENGSCKTTIIKMLFYTMSMQWRNLSAYNFESITITINNVKHKITKSQISAMHLHRSSTHRLPSLIRREIDGMSHEGEINMKKIELLCIRYGFSFSAVLRELDFTDDLFSKESKRIKDVSMDIKKAFKDTHILYLPTYRRIEQELKVVLDGRVDESEYRTKRLPHRENNNYTELIEFGMNDVIEAQQQVLNSLKDFSRDSLNSLTLGYLGDVVEKEYDNIDIKAVLNVNENTINDIIKRVDETILSNRSKDRLSNILQQVKIKDKLTEHDKVVCHYFIKLHESHKALEKKEIQIRNFNMICGNYLQNKTFYYDSSNFTFKIISNIDQQEIKPEQLSSGEKQIVSLFSYLYLSNKKHYFVLIDEPELSLSVKWQKQFLVDVKNGGFCNGLIAVTHSPFIFDNELDSYAHGLGEFIK